MAGNDLEGLLKCNNTNYKERILFSPDWFVFGEDHYFCLWLCYKGEDCDGHCFTCWDHESGLEIDEPVWRDLLSFLKEMEEAN